MATEAKYLNSTQVQVYPSAYRGKNGNSEDPSAKVFNPEARLNSEFNITNIINSIVGIDRFVLDYIENTHILTFNIKGYWFKVDLSDFFDSGEPLAAGTSYRKVWASIKIDPKNTDVATGNIDYAAYSLSPLDNYTSNFLDVDSGGEYTFVGLKFVFGGENDTVTDDSRVFYLPILKYDSELNKFVVPTENTFRFRATNIQDEENGYKNISEEFKSGSIKTEALEVNGNSDLKGTLDVTGITSITNTTESSSISSGALKVSGGVGIAKKLNVGDITTLEKNLVVKDTTELKKTTTVSSGNLKITSQKTDSNHTAALKITSDGTITKNILGASDDSISGATSRTFTAEVSQDEDGKLHYKSANIPMASSSTAGLVKINLSNGVLEIITTE